MTGLYPQAPSKGGLKLGFWIMLNRAQVCCTTHAGWIKPTILAGLKHKRFLALLFVLEKVLNGGKDLTNAMETQNAFTASGFFSAKPWRRKIWLQEKFFCRKVSDVKNHLTHTFTFSPQTVTKTFKSAETNSITAEKRSFLEKKGRRERPKRLFLLPDGS